MSPSTLDDFITKKEVEQRYGRSHRSLTRDFSTAVRTRNTDILSNLRLHTEDDKVREGTEVSLEMIQDLSNSGLTPTWYVHRVWAESRYGSRSDQPTKKPIAERTPDASPVDSATEHNHVIAILKEQLHRVQEEHQKDKEAFRDQIKMFKEMFDTLKDDHADTKSLLKEVHKVFGNVSQSFLGRPQDLPAQPTEVTADPPGKNESAVSSVRDTVIVEQPLAPRRERGTAPKKTMPNKSASKSTASKKRATNSQKKLPTKPPAKPTSWTDKHLPTFKWFFLNK